MKTNIIALSQKDLHLLAMNLNSVRLGYNCYLYENDLHTKENICKALNLNADMIIYYDCYQVAYCCNAFGNSGQLHRVELEQWQEPTLLNLFIIHRLNIRINKYRLFINLFFYCLVVCVVMYIIFYD